MSEYDADRNGSDRSESDSKRNKDGPSETKFESAKKAFNSAIEKLSQSTHQKSPVMRYGCNEYMTKVAKIREPKSYVEAAHDANWQTTIEE